MLKAVLLLLSGLLSVGLVYFLGAWVLLALFAVLACAFRFSTGPAPAEPEREGDGQTGYTGMTATF